MQDLVQIVERLAPDLGDLEGEPTPLEGGITNRNYLATLGGTRYVIRVPGKDTSELGIDRGAEKDPGELASSLGISPRVAVMLTDPQCLVTEFVEGETMDAEKLREPARMKQVAAVLQELHYADKTLSTDFNSFRVVEDYAKTAAERGVEVPAAYEEAHGHSTAIEQALSGPEHGPVPCHNDLLAANFIDGERLWIVDWDYAGMGNRYFDLGNFSVNNELDDSGQAALLEVYFGEAADARRIATLKLFRFMSDFREAMWGVVQQGLSDLDFDFVDYATTHFERMGKTASDPSFAGWIEEAGGS